MGVIRTAADQAYRDYVTNGVPSSGANKPSKSEIRDLFATVEIAVEAAEAGEVVQATWAGLAAIAGTRAGQPGRVTGTDAGTHTDPVVGGTVDNEGEYTWSVSPAGWQRIGDIADPAALRAEVEEARGGEASLDARLDGIDATVAEKAPLVWSDGTELQPSATDADWAIMDADDNVAAKVQDGDFYAAFAGRSVEFGKLARKAVETIASVQAKQNGRHFAPIQPVSAKWNAIFVIGQSRGKGQQSVPDLSRTTTAHAYMLGRSEHGTGSSTWTRVGSDAAGSRFNLLRSTVLDNSAVLQDDATVDALTAGTDYIGESPAVSATMMLAEAWNDGSRPDREFVLLNCCDSGEPWDDWLPGGANPPGDGTNYYNRLVAAYAAFLAECSARGETGAVVGLVFNGGEYNFRSDSSDGQDYTSVLGWMNTIRDAANAMFMADQDFAPATFVVLPDSAYVTNEELDGNGNAHLDFALLNEGVFLSGGAHHVTDYQQLHLTSNGYRWVGNKLGQTFARVLVDRLDADIVRPLWLYELNDVTYAGFSARAYPLQFLPTYAGTSGGVQTGSLATDYGLMLIDDTGTISFAEPPTIIHGCIVKMVQSRARNGTGRLWIARNPGSTNLADSDNSKARDRYTLMATTAAETVAALDDNRYPMNNFAPVGSWLLPTEPNVFIDAIHE